MKQTWHDLLFAHWPVPQTTIRSLVPPQLTLDAFDGQCWIGVVPFHMSRIHRRGLPPIPLLSRFAELNVRTYVTFGGKAGVYFFSLDAASLPAVWAARALYHLPYFHAKMKVQEVQSNIRYSSRRYRGDAVFRGSYVPTGEVQLAKADSLKHWLTERYCLYTTHRDVVYRAEIHHQPWPLQEAQAEIEVNLMASAAGIHLPEIEPILYFARRLEVLIWPLLNAQSPQR